MNQPNPQPWYQDGWTMFIVAFLMIPGFSYLGYIGYQNQLPPAKLQLTGRMEGGGEQNSTLVLTTWHQHPGTLHKGKLSVSVNGKSQYHSFETWEPNDAQAIVLTFPLSHYAPDQEIPVTIRLVTKDTKPFHFQDAWLGITWKSN